MECLDTLTIISTVASVLTLLTAIIVFIRYFVHTFFPEVQISPKICKHYSQGKYRIKIRNESISDAKIISVTYIIYYKRKGSNSKIDFPFSGKNDPLMFGRLVSPKRKGIIKTLYTKFTRTNNIRVDGLKTFRTFLIDAQKIDKNIILYASEEITKKYQKKELTIEDFKEDEDAILVAVFEIQNYRTGKTRSFSNVYYLGKDIIEGEFVKGRSFDIDTSKGKNPDEDDAHY